MAKAEGYDEFLHAPVVGGMWTHGDVVRGVYTMDDLFDACEMIIVKGENERRAREQAEREAKARRR